MTYTKLEPIANWQHWWDHSV